MQSGMAKGTSQVEAALNSKKIKHIALAIVELCESEGIRQFIYLVSYLVSHSLSFT